MAHFLRWFSRLFGCESFHLVPYILLLLSVLVYVWFCRLSILKGYSYGCKVPFKYIKICFQNFKQYSLFKIPQKLKKINYANWNAKINLLLPFSINISKIEKKNLLYFFDCVFSWCVGFCFILVYMLSLIRSWGLNFHLTRSMFIFSTY